MDQHYAAGTWWTQEDRTVDDAPRPTYIATIDGIVHELTHRDCPCGRGWHLLVTNPVWVHCSHLSDPADAPEALSWAGIVIEASRPQRSPRPPMRRDEIVELPTQHQVRPPSVSTRQAA